MKQTRLGQKKPRFINGLCIYITAFLTFIMVVLILAGDEVEPLEPWERVLFIGPVALILAVGTCLYLFFNKQIVSIIDN